MPRDTRAYLKDIVDGCDRITEGPRIVDFRNQSTQEYVHVNDTVVWGTIERNLAKRRSEWAAILSELDHESGDRCAPQLLARSVGGP